MILLNVLKDSFILLRKNLIIVQPLIIFLFLLLIVLSPLLEARQVQLGVPFAIMLLSVSGFICSFLAGWYNLFYFSIKNPEKKELTEEEHRKNQMNLLKQFFPGVSKYFIQIFAGLWIGLGLFLAFYFVFALSGLKIWLSTIANMSVEELAKLLNTLIADTDKLFMYTEKDFYRLFKFLSVLIFFITTFFTYLFMFWIHAIVGQNKGPFSSYLFSLKTIYKKPLLTLTLYSITHLSIVLFLYLIAYLTKLTESLPDFVSLIIQFLELMLLLFILVYSVMVTFVYFEKHTENNCDSRAYSDGQN